MYAIRNALTAHTAQALKQHVPVRHFGPNPPVDLTKVPVGKITGVAVATLALATAAAAVKKEAPKKPPQ